MHDWRGACRAGHPRKQAISSEAKDCSHTCTTGKSVPRDQNPPGLHEEQKAFADLSKAPNSVEGAQFCIGTRPEGMRFSQPLPPFPPPFPFSSLSLHNSPMSSCQSRALLSLHLCPLSRVRTCCRKKLRKGHCYLYFKVALPNASLPRPALNLSLPL